MMAFMIYLWAGIAMSLMWREAEDRYTSLFLLIWVGAIWPVVPVLWLIEVIEGKP